MILISFWLSRISGFITVIPFFSLGFIVDFRSTAHVDHSDRTLAEMENWFDEEEVVPDRPDVEVEDDLFAFEAGPQIIPNGTEGGKLEPLPEGFEDLLGDRGVIMNVKKRASSANGASSSSGGSSKKSEEERVLPSKEAPYLEIHYAGYILSKEGERGESFDRTVEYALVVKLNFPWVAEGNLIRGLDTALRQLSPGDEAEIRIKSRYAYGEDGCAPNIEPNTDLSFDVNILDVRRTPKRTVEETDDTETELSRLETIRKEREAAAARRQEEEALKTEAKSEKVDRVAALREKLAAKQNKGKGKGKKKKKK